jgi:hypothetical protein
VAETIDGVRSKLSTESNSVPSDDELDRVHHGFASTSSSSSSSSSPYDELDRVHYGPSNRGGNKRRNRMIHLESVEKYDDDESIPSVVTCSTISTAGADRPMIDQGELIKQAMERSKMNQQQSSWLFVFGKKTALK